ncbi:MAG: hypothetical protein K2X11_03220, partial [Acetobacteraceae bacterium]|nr:hypothetical protein [Acetobacteraceae bacterium]
MASSATGALEGDSIGFPIRRIFSRQKNFTFHLAEVQKIDTEAKIVTANIGDIHYDELSKKFERNHVPESGYL